MADVKAVRVGKLTLRSGEATEAVFRGPGQDRVEGLLAYGHVDGDSWRRRWRL